MAAKKRRKKQEEEASEAWLLPYSDLMTLLLAVFIVLFAVSKIDQGKADAMSHAFQSWIVQGGSGVLDGDGESLIQGYPDGTGDQPQQKDTTTATEETTEAAKTTEEQPAGMEQELGEQEFSSLQGLEKQLIQLFDKEGMASDVTMNIDSRGLVISLRNAIFFDSGSADIKPENLDTLERVAQTINKVDNYIRIEGHTDNRPIHTSRYPSNWELSAARASSVVRLFIDQCGIKPEKVVAVGYGEYKPVAENKSQEGRERNRRIDIIILSEKYNSLEEQIQK